MERKGFVKKYKNFKEAQTDQWVFNPEKDYFERVLFMLSMGLLKRIGSKFPRGVFKYGSFEDAQEDDLQWILRD